MNPRRLTPSMSLLVAFEASARHLSFTRAAQELSLTQSAVSRQVQALEALLEVPLFRREQRRIVLTEAGVMYQRELGGALQRIRNASLQAIAYRTGGGSFHLAALPTFAAKWLMPRLNGFYAMYPGTLVHVHSRIGQFDLGLAGMDAVISVGDGTWPGLVAHHLIDEHVLPVISPALARASKMQNPADISQHLLLQVAARPDVWHRWFMAQGLPLASMRLGPQFELTSHLIQAVASGIGVGLLPSFLVEDELRSGVLELAFDLPLTTGAAYYLFIPLDKLGFPPVAAFRDWILQFEDASSPPAAFAG
jgi:LysR family glycine cleavage system transcriptional activator